MNDTDSAARGAALRLDYPAAARVDQVDIYHGTAVADPYRWLEEADSAATQEWVEAQNQLTSSFLSAIPSRDRIEARLRELWDYDKYSVPFREGGRVFYFRNTGLQNQSVLYTAPSPDAEARVLLDPNTLSADGTTALAGFSVSEDGTLLAYALSSAGSDWQEWRVRLVDTGEDLQDLLRWSKFSSAAWTHDNRGFFYGRYDEPAGDRALQEQNTHHKVYYHRLGTDQSEDLLIFERPDEPHWMASAGVTEDGRLLILSVRRGTDPENRLFVKDLVDPTSPVLGVATAVLPVIPEATAKFSVIGSDGNALFVQTNLGAPRERLVRIDFERPEPELWTEIIPEGPDLLEQVSYAGGRFFALYLKDAYSAVSVFDESGRALGAVDLPGIGTAYGFHGKRTDTDLFYGFTSFSFPAVSFHYDIESGKSSVYRRPSVAFDSEDFQTEQVFYASKDGTQVPMFLTYRRGMQPGPETPVLLHAYGGFSASMTPNFSISRIAWMEMGGIYAQACLRGGGEYGREWHDAGRQKHKQNVFDDFIAAAEWLIANGYTSTPRLAIQGGSNGGLLVGACLNQRPDLFGAAVPVVGVMDMVRFPLFTIGWAWKSDYGDPQVAEDFETLYRYSPLHNIRQGATYPPTLVMTSDHDDRVVPAHSYKYAAALQAAQGGDAPILIRIETQAGHGAGKPTDKVIAEVADMYAFLVSTLRVDFRPQAG